MAKMLSQKFKNKIIKVRQYQNVINLTFNIAIKL